eukprot:scaffold244855_cov15-Tisochrysis_lutea.AAC.1
MTHTRKSAAKWRRLADTHAAGRANRPASLCQISVRIGDQPLDLLGSTKKDEETCAHLEQHSAPVSQYPHLSANLRQIPVHAPTHACKQARPAVVAIRVHPISRSEAAAFAKVGQWRPLALLGSPWRQAMYAESMAATGFWGSDMLQRQFLTWVPNP